MTHLPHARIWITCLTLATVLAGCAGTPAAPTSAPTPTSIPATATPLPPTATTAPASTATTAPATAQPTSTAPASPTAAATTTGTTTPATAARPAFSGEAAYKHVDALSVGIGIRATGTDGEARAATYLDEQLRSFGYTVTRQPFPITGFRDEGATLTVAGIDDRLQPTTMRLSGAGQVTAPLALVPGTGTAAEVARADVKGRIALIERGGLTFQEKVGNAKAAGAAAVLVYNNADGTLTGTLSSPAELPVAGLTRADGARLRQAVERGGDVTASLAINASVTRTPSQNVIADRPDLPETLPVIVIGGHFDSVPAGPGANDNGSGTAVALELARVLANERRAAVRVVGFGAEEIGLIGSRQYVESLSPAERKRIMAMINLDMLAVGQELQIGGSDDLVTKALAVARDLGIQNVSRMPANARTGGASDHASFISAGIPSLFLNRPDDPRYHTAQDQTGHVPPEALRIAGDISLGVIDQLLTP